MNILADSSFWSFNIGQVGSLVVVLTTMLHSFTRFHQKLVQAQFKQDEAVDDIKKLVDRVEYMDRSGTQASRQVLVKDTEILSQSVRRIETLERTMSEVAPKLTEVLTNVSWITHYIQDRDAGLKRRAKAEN
jgi:hypothetical protein